MTEEQVKTFRGHRSFEVVKNRWIVARCRRLDDVQAALEQGL